MRDSVTAWDPQELPTAPWNMTPIEPGLTVLKILADYKHSSPLQPTVLDF